MRQHLKVISCFTVVLFFLAGCVKSSVASTDEVVVSAGTYDTLQLPADSVTLTGTVIKGLTPSTTYLWTLVSGPGVPMFILHAA